MQVLQQNWQLQLITHGMSHHIQYSKDYAIGMKWLLGQCPNFFIAETTNALQATD